MSLHEYGCPVNNSEINISGFTKRYTLFSVDCWYHTPYNVIKVSKVAKIRSRYNQVPHLTQDTNGKVTNSQLDTTNESQEVSPFPAGDHKAHITDAHKGIANIRQNQNIKDPQKKYRLGTVSKIFYWRA